MSKNVGELLVFYTFAVFRFGSLLKSILDHLGVDFGVVWEPIFNHFSDPRGGKKFNEFSCFFMLFNFGLHVGR